MKPYYLLLLLLIIPAYAIVIEDGVIFEDDEYSYTANITFTNVSTIELSDEFYLDTVKWCNSDYKNYFTSANPCFVTFALNISETGIEWCKLVFG